MFLFIDQSQFASDQNAIDGGVRVGIGTPPQTFSLLPTTADHDIYVANKADYASSYNDSCIRGYG